MNILLHLEIDIICAVMLCLILRCTASFDGAETERHLFLSVQVFTLLLLALDAVWASMAPYLPIVLCYAVNAAYLITLGALSLLWYLYTDCAAQQPPVRSFGRRLLLLLPFLAILVLVLFSTVSEGIFWIDQAHQYQRGALYPLYPVLTFSYTLMSAVQSLLRSLRERNLLQRQRYLSLASFIILPLLGGIAELFTPAPVLTASITLSLLLVFLQGQERQISRDPLTQLNNRRELNRHLTSCMADKTSFTLLLLDADGFKQINDTYGHVEGDAALVLIADAMRQSFRANGQFLARYGGDEFVVVLRRADAADTKQLQEQFAACLRAYCAHRNLPYPLTVSGGYVVYTGEDESISHLLSLADADLYRNKRKRHRAALQPRHT